MGLFSTLASSSTTTSSSTSKIPTMIQLYGIPGEPLSLSDVPTGCKYATLSYQAVQVAPPDDTKEAYHHSPDLGVYNFLVTPNNNNNESALVDHLLQIPDQQHNAYGFTISLKEMEQVEPTLSAMQEALVRHLIQRDNNNNNTEDNQHPEEQANEQAKQDDTATPMAAATTRLQDLQTVHFGLAPTKTKEPKVDEQNVNANVVVTLIISAILPLSTQNEDDYRHKQAQALLLYHLRRYAAALNATLIFIDETPTIDDSPTTTTTLVPTFPRDQLAAAWKELAEGRFVQSPTVTPKESQEEEESSLVYGPGTHQEDLIESVLLRNAHYPGHWDAEKDSIWVALPPNHKPKEDALKPTATGDAGWLKQLRDSVASVEPTPKKKTKPVKAATPAPPKDAAVSNFFESLLK